jgi:hypothetical protein
VGGTAIFLYQVWGSRGGFREEALKQADNLTVKTRPTQLLEEIVRQVLVGGYWLVAKVRGQVLNKGIQLATKVVGQVLNKIYRLAAKVRGQVFEQRLLVKVKCNPLNLPLH